MTRTVEMIVPPTGEPIDAARLVGWIVQPSQAFKAGDVLMEIETDKSIIEVTAEQDGVMVEHRVAVDGVVNADTVVAVLQVEGEALADTGSRPDPEPSSGPESGPAPQPAPQLASSPAPAATQPPAARPPTQSSPAAPGSPDNAGRLLATPAARQAARQQGIDLARVRGSGPDGRVTLSDIEAAMPSAARGRSAAAETSPDKREARVSTRHGDLHVALWDTARDRAQQTVVLLHGLFGDTDTWAAPALTLSRAGARVLAIDLPCHGQTDSRATRFGDIVDAVADVIASQCSGRVVLVGHSFGGAVAARAAGRPDLGVDGLVLIAPVGLGTEIEQRFLDGMIHAGTREAVQRELAKLTAAGILPSAAFVDALRDRTQASQAELAALCREAAINGVQQLNIVPDLARATCHCTLLHGRRDAIVPWQHALNAPAHTALHLLPDAGHMPQWEAGKLVTDILLQTVRRPAP